jgi:phage gpG-like protein
MANQAQQFIDVMNRIAAVWGTLPNKAATVAVNFSKRRFVEQNWVGNTTQPWKKRKNTRSKRDASRAILVKSARLKRDVHKIVVTPQYAIIGTSQLTGAYARVHNEGFRGLVTIKEFKRSHYSHVKEKYTTRSGRERSRTRKTVVDGMKTTVRTHVRKMNIPKRQFLGNSPVLDRDIEKMMAYEIIKAIKQ